MRGRFGLEQRCVRASASGEGFNVLKLTPVHREAYKHPDLYDEEARQRAKGERNHRGRRGRRGRSQRSTWRRQLRSPSRDTESDNTRFGILWLLPGSCSEAWRRLCRAGLREMRTRQFWMA